MPAYKILRPFLAHPINLYRTPIEHSLVSLIAYHFAVRTGDVTYLGLSQNIACDALVAMPFLDGRLGIDVAILANRFAALRVPIFVVILKKAFTSRLLREFESDHTSGLFDIRQVLPSEMRLIGGAHPSLVLPKDETLLSIRTDEDTVRPYELSHTVTRAYPATIGRIDE